MRYLRSYKKEFNHCVRQDDLSLYLSDSAAADILPSIAQLIELRTKETLRRGLVRCLSGIHSRLFVKTVQIDSLPSRLRATFGLQRRNGGHIWPVAELLNSIEAFRLGAPVPRVIGFGYRRRGMSLVRELFMISELLDGHVDGLRWLQEPGAELEPFLRRSFTLLRRLHELQIFHLDLWVGNIMFDPAREDDLRVVDLENCYIGAVPCLSEALGFQFGFFYYRFVQQHIDESRYDQLVMEALAAYPAIDMQRFAGIYATSKSRHTSRKKRRGLLLTGTL